MKKIRLLLITVAMMLVMTITAYAAFGVNIQFSDPSAKVGETFTVTMKIKATGGNLGSAKVMLNYDPSYLEFVSGDHAEGGAGTVKVSGDTSLGKTEWAYSLKFKALAPGSTSITVDDSWEIYDESQNMAKLDHKGSSSVTIEGDANGSINANLSSLKVSPGVLIPEFSPEVTEYSVLVGGECNKIAVSAPTADSNAKVIISGNSDLQIGDNVVTCQVTAQDGTTTKTYTINVTKQEGEVDYGDAAASFLQATVNGMDYEVAETFDETLLPEGFTSQTKNYKGKEVMTGVNQNTGLTLMYLLGDDGSGDLFVYDEATDQWSPYAMINTAEKSITVVPMGSDVTVPEGFAETTLELNGKKVHGWIWSADVNQDYCMVYGMNSEGEVGFYRYDMKEKTIQRFFSNPVSTETVSEDEYVDAATKYNELIKDYTLRGYILIGLGVISGILLIALIIALVTSRGNGGGNGGGGSQQKKKKKRRSAEDEEDERLRQIRAQRAQERQMRREQQERQARGYDEAEERYMRGVENPEDEYTKVIPNEQIRNQYAQQQQAQLQRDLAREVQKSTEPEQRPNRDTSGDDGFETFDL